MAAMIIAPVSAIVAIMSILKRRQDAPEQTSDGEVVMFACSNVRPPAKMRVVSIIKYSYFWKVAQFYWGFEGFRDGLGFDQGLIQTHILEVASACLYNKFGDQYNLEISSIRFAFRQSTGPGKAKLKIG